MCGNVTEPKNAMVVFLLLLPENVLKSDASSVTKKKLRHRVQEVLINDALSLSLLRQSSADNQLMMLRQVQ